MAKKSRRSSRRTKTVRRPKSSKRTTHMAAEMEAVADTDRNIDGCDVDFTKGDITQDAELPPARGGVETVQTSRRRTANRR